MNRRNIRRCRHVIDNSIKERLNAAIFIRSTADNRRHLTVNGSFSDNFFDLFDADFLTTEVFFHKLIIIFGTSLKEFIAIFLRDFSHIIRNFNLISNLAKIIFIDNGLHFDKIDNYFKSIFSTNRQLNRNCISVETITHHLNDVEEIRTGNVHFVDISHTRNIVTLRLTPDCLGLRFNTTTSSQNCNSTVKNTERTLNFNSEINVTRGINNIDSVTLPMAGSSC